MDDRGFDEIANSIYIVHWHSRGTGRARVKKLQGRKTLMWIISQVKFYAVIM